MTGGLLLVLAATLTLTPPLTIEEQHFARFAEALAAVLEEP